MCRLKRTPLGHTEERRDKNFNPTTNGQGIKRGHRKHAECLEKLRVSFVSTKSPWPM